MTILNWWRSPPSFNSFVFLGKPIFKTAIFFELQLQYLMDSLFPLNFKNQKSLNKELTIIIKTFERPRVLKRFMKSIKRFYLELPIILVDDSKVPTHIDGIETIEMPYDIGVLACRNKALELVETEFLLMVDDDFVFFRSTDLIKPYERIKANPNIDIMGGKVINLPFYTSIDYSNEGIHPTKAAPMMPPGSYIDGMPVLDKVANFYIGRTASIRKVGWDERIKRLDHADFFTRAKGVLTTVANDEFQCLHAPTIFDKKYMAIRNDADSDMHVLHTKYYS